MKNLPAYPVSLLLWCLALASAPALAQNVPAHAQGLKEELLTVELDGGRKQSGVYSTRIGVDKPRRLAVLLPGSPSVVRPVVENGVMVSSRLSGNFLLRARRWLADDAIATLVVDCHSESGSECASRYQASRQRQDDVGRLVREARSRAPTIEQVWLVGTSLGTLSSAFMPTHDPAAYAGAIHTASITNPYRSVRELIDFDYRKSSIPQFFVHHRNDPCPATTFSGAREIADKYKLPLIAVSGGSGFQGGACEAFSEHGFRGKEREVMEVIGEIIKTGKTDRLEIN